MNHVDVTVNLLHDNLYCWYVFMKWHDVYKMLFDTIYVTVIGHKWQTTVNHRCSDSIYQRIDKNEIGKLYNLQ